jgi:secreted trypsin-like serine protease
MNLLFICYFMAAIGIGASSALDFVVRDTTIGNLGTNGAVPPLADLADTTDEALAPRIVGGTPVAAGAYPWFARSSQTFLDGGVFFSTYSCGASLIHPRVAISAMHCIGRVLSPTIFFTAQITLYFGGTLYDGSDALAVRTVKRYEYLPNYNSVSNDIVLYTWDDPITNIVPIVFNRKNDLPLIGPLARAIGFGLTTVGGSEATVLQQVDLNVVNVSVCNNFFSDVDVDLSESELVCVQTPGKGICRGDSGGPLFGTVDGTLTLFGSASFGGVCGAAPSGYAAPRHFQTFIDQVRCHIGPHIFFFATLSPPCVCMHAYLTDIISSWYNSSSARLRSVNPVVSWVFSGACSLSYSSASN